jgi:CDP-diacylglycerol--glycerol-3-phosphate 3-phosphatidyltransferase
MRINLPNQITLARLVLAIVFCCLLTRFDGRQREAMTRLIDWTLGVFIVAALSDVLDGYLARRSNQVTSFGRVVDPFVDKLLVLGGFILMLGRNFYDAAGTNLTGLEAWMIVIIVGRELLVTGLRGLSESRGSAFAANAAGKLKMWVQCVTLGWILVGLRRGSESAAWTAARDWWITATLVVTVASLLAYLVQARSALAERARA